MAEGQVIAHGRIETFNLSFTSRENSIITFKNLKDGRLYDLLWGNIYDGIAAYDPKKRGMTDMVRLALHEDEHGEIVDDVLLEGDYISGVLANEDPEGLFLKFTVCARTYVVETIMEGALRRGMPIEVREVGT